MNPDQENPATPPPVPPAQPEPPLEQPQPAPQPDPVVAPAPVPAPTPSPTNPNRILSIVGLIAAVFFSAVGLIISIIALVKSKKAGIRDGIALAGVIVGSVTTALALASIITLGALLAGPAGQVVTKCIERSSTTNIVVVDGRSYDCDDLNIGALFSNKESSNVPSSSKSITGTPVTLTGSTVAALCWTTTLPDDYLMNPNSVACQTEFRMDNGSSTGVALTSITIKPQVGQSTVDDFFEKVEATGADIASREYVTIDGIRSGKVITEDSYGLGQVLYYIPDTTKRYSASNGVITSYLITGPSNMETSNGKNPIDGIVAAFSIN